MALREGKLSVCSSKIPSKVALFVCTNTLDNILTVGTGSSYNREVCDPNRGTLHKATPETVDHLIIHCSFASAVSDVYLSRFAIGGLAFYLHGIAKPLQSTSKNHFLRLKAVVEWILDNIEIVELLVDMATGR